MNPLAAAPAGWQPPEWIPAATPPLQHGWFWVTVEAKDGRRYTEQRWYSNNSGAWNLESAPNRRVVAWMPVVPYTE